MKSVWLATVKNISSSSVSYLEDRTRLKFSAIFRVQPNCVIDISHNGRPVKFMYGADKNYSNSPICKQCSRRIIKDKLFCDKCKNNFHSTQKFSMHP